MSDLPTGPARHQLAAHVRAALRIALALSLSWSCASAQLTAAVPEVASGLAAKTLVVARHRMVVAANPHATDAGLAILEAGGSAVDAAIAVQLVLNLVEPQSSGLGGGAFLIHWNAKAKRVSSFDGRETAPQATDARQFLQPDGTPMPFPAAVLSGASTGVPGVPHLLETAYRAHGKLPWPQLFAPAIALAENGFPVSPRLHALLAAEPGGAASFDAVARAYLFDATGKPWPVGHVLKNPAFAETLRALAIGGARAFYAGPIAAAIAEQVPRITLADLTAYGSKQRPALCSLYRQHRICGMGPPSSGALTVGATLALLEPLDLGTVPLAPRALHLIAEAEKLAFADRDQFIADPDFVPVPTGLLDRAYLTQRRTLIAAGTTQGKALPGTPPAAAAKRAGADATAEVPGTSHISIVDGDGNAAAMTTTIETAFGAHRMAAGFLLNNQLTDFSFRPVDAAGNAVANAAAPGKRPRSSMAPTFVFAPNGKLMAVVGSAGGSAIILHVVKTIVGIVDWRLDAQAAVDLPTFGSRNGPFEIESKLSGDLIGLKMAAYGHKVVNADVPSGLHVIVRRRDGWLEGGADPRREGVARGN